MESPDEEFPDDEEETELSEEELAAEMEPFIVADWKQEFPDYTAEELEEKLPDRTRSSWMAPVVSCLFGTLLGAAIAGVLVNDQPRAATGPLHSSSFSWSSRFCFPVSGIGCSTCVVNEWRKR